MTVKIEKLEFGATIDEKDRCLIQIIYPIDSGRTGHKEDCEFIHIEELRAAIDFLEKEINR